MKVLWYGALLCSFALASCTPNKKMNEPVNYYTEQYRPQFHFSPAKNWMNDPNGMVFFDGEYHLFYQHYPDGNVWGPMHWGHAVSTDLVSWQHLPIALYPDILGMIFSGSAVVDSRNTSGFGSPEKPALVAIFTQHFMEGEKAGKHDFQTQGIAYSIDKGRTWKMYTGNPVIKNPGKHDFRDPKVFWHEPSQQWKMILAVKDHVELYGSPDLKTWSYLSSFGVDIGAHGGVWECPDLFEMSVQGSEQKKWVMLVSINPGAPNGGSGTQYFIGQFDGQQFTQQQTDTLWLDYGKDNYAGVTWSNVGDGRRLFLGWMSNWQYATVVPTTVWRSAMTVSRELKLEETKVGLRVTSYPVKELEDLRNEPKTITHFLESESDKSAEITLEGQSNEIELTIEKSKSVATFEIQFSNNKQEFISIGVDTLNQLYINRTQSGQKFSKDFVGKHYGKRNSTSDTIKLRLLLDASSIEVFADDGAVMTDLFFSTEPFNKMQIKSNKGVSIPELKIYTLNSIWKQGN
jgi:fructan beta-fructosidase